MKEVLGKLILITPPYMAVEEMLMKIEAAIYGGVDTVQLRRWDLCGKELYLLALKLRKMTRAKGTILIINDRLDIAKAVDADGIHLGRSSFSPEVARAILGKRKIIGRSIHSLKEFTRDEEPFLDYLIVSPIFKTHSKPGVKPLGVDILKRFRRKTALPIYALGGINTENVHLVSENACGVAVISAIIYNKKIIDTVRKLK